MFNLNLPEHEDSVDKPTPKKIKLNEARNSKPVHSSLKYSSFKAPPLVEYNSIDGYCENKPGKSLVLSDEKSDNSLFTTGLGNLQSVSSPILFKSPKVSPPKITLSINGSKHYAFFTVEELGLVNCLKHWMNTKVCAVGITYYTCDTGQCYLQSVMESGSWQLLLDTSLLQEVPGVQMLIQIFGILELIDRIPRVKVNFYRNLGTVNLSLFIESYRLMQKYVPEYKNPSQNEKEVENDQEVLTLKPTVELNDTLDDYNFSVIM